MLEVRAGVAVGVWPCETHAKATAKTAKLNARMINLTLLEKWANTVTPNIDPTA